MYFNILLTVNVESLQRALNDDFLIQNLVPEWTRQIANRSHSSDDIINVNNHKVSCFEKVTKQQFKLKLNATKQGINLVVIFDVSFFVVKFQYVILIYTTTFQTNMAIITRTYFNVS